MTPFFPHFGFFGLWHNFLGDIVETKVEHNRKSEHEWDLRLDSILKHTCAPRLIQIFSSFSFSFVLFHNILGRHSEE